MAAFDSVLQGYSRMYKNQVTFRWNFDLHCGLVLTSLLTARQ